MKHIFLAAKLPLDRIGAFYLLYALYFKQPTELFCKVRVTLADWREIKRFVLERPQEEAPQLVVIFWKMFIGDAFRFVQDEKEYGYDSFFIKGGQSSKYDDKVRESFKIIREAEKDFKSMKSITGLFTALDALEMGYNEMKESLDGKFKALFLDVADWAIEICNLNDTTTCSAEGTIGPRTRNDPCRDLPPSRDRLR